MYLYEVWVRVNQWQTAHIRIRANNDLEAKLIAEAQYGSGNVLSYTQISE